NKLVETRIGRAPHELHAGSSVVVDDSRNAIPALGFCRTGKQHVLVACQMRADFEPFVGAFGQDAGRERPEIFPVLDPAIEDSARVRPAGTSERRSRASNEYATRTDSLAC